MHETGTEVVVLERDEKPRGNTSLSGGQIPAAGTKLQKAAGIDDPPDLLAKDLIKKAKEIMLAVLIEHPKVLESPAPFVGVKELADSSVNYVVRPWCKAADYWDVYFDITEKVKYALEENGLTIPFPQRDVHMINAPTS